MKHFLLLCLAPAVVAAQQTSRLTEELRNTVLYEDVAISPNGGHVAWVQSTAATTDKRIHVQETSQNAASSPVTLGGSGERSDADPTFSPDSKTLCFLSNNGDQEQKQIWLSAADGSNPKKVTTLKGYLSRPHWSHDGRQIAFLYIENAGGGGPLMAAPVVTGVVDTAIHNQRIAILDVKTSAVRQVSPADLHVYDFDWSADDKTFVCTAAPGPGDNNWWVAQIYTIDITAGTAKSIYKPSLQVAVPRWAPDGKHVAFIEGLMSDEGFHGGDLFTMSAEGGDPTNLMPGRKSSVSAAYWLTPDRIVVTEYIGGGSAISEFTLSSKSTQTLWSGGEEMHAAGNFANFALSPDGKWSVTARSDFNTPPEIWAGPVGKWRCLTRDNATLTATWGKAQELRWTNDNFDIQGWVLPPARVEPDKKYPLVVLIHGGPAASETPAWPGSLGLGRAIGAALSTNGYYVLLPNPRGSYGQGENFVRANVKDFGGGDLRDIMKGVDTAVAKFPIDARRIGISGWSYGGYMTMWAVTQTNRFRAAVAGAGIANWQSYYGENLIDQWMIPFFGASVYDAPYVYEKSSPMHFIKNVKTPTLVIVGEHDAECPAPQSYEFWHALRALDVPTQLIVYPGEGHWFVRPENQTDRLDRTIAWFDKYLK